MIYEVIKGVSLPFLGTVLGSLCVFFMKDKVNPTLEKVLCGFAAGVMCAASVWSLLLPSLEYSSNIKYFGFVPTVIGFMLGVLFVIVLDVLVDSVLAKSQYPAAKSYKKDSIILIIAISVHNLPEGMAVGIVYAGIAFGSADMSLAFALALSAGIALQNFPEGAIVSMPLKARGKSKFKAFLYGVISGIVELLGAIVTLFVASYAVVVMPYMLAFAAGAMMYVVAVELLPEMSGHVRSYAGVIAFAVGFCVMMALDTALG